MGEQRGNYTTTRIGRNTTDNGESATCEHTLDMRIKLKTDYEWDKEGIQLGLMSFLSQVPWWVVSQQWNKAATELNKRQGFDKIQLVEEASDMSMTKPAD